MYDEVTGELTPQGEKLSFAIEEFVLAKITEAYAVNPSHGRYIVEVAQQAVEDAVSVFVHRNARKA